MSISCRFASLLLIFTAAAGLVADASPSGSLPRLARTSSGAAGRGDTGEIERLISQLGDDQYFFRHHAEEQLIQRGADVFDQLQAAEDHPDLEIAARAHYILQRIQIEWVHPDDSAAVQAAMKNYGDLSKEERLERMEQLVALADDEGLAGLCRIVRYEPAPRLARAAALVVMQSGLAGKQSSARAGIVLHELGDSSRVPVEWLRTYGEQLQYPEKLDGRWLTLIDEEIARYQEDSPETNVLFVFRLLSCHLQLCREASQPDATVANLNRRIELCSQPNEQIRQLFAVLSRSMTRTELMEFLGPAQVANWLLTEERGEDFGLAYAMNWLWKNEQWEAIELLEDQYDESIRRQRLLIYLSAAARWKQGRDELAEEFAERAYRLDADDAATRDDIGDLIGEMGRHDWAEREWRSVIEAFPIVSSRVKQLELSMSARLSLALLRLHDRGDEGPAAELLAEVIDTLDQDPKLKRALNSSALGRHLLTQCYVQKDFFLACQAEADGDFKAQRKHLEAALLRNPRDPDILIAMYRLKGSDKKFRKQTVKYIQEAVRAVEDEIEKEPNYAQWHNHWAWLVSNTEGDYDLAVKHSQRSLELSPDSPSYLDTLGRCYYAAGKLEDAVRVQREAVRRHPHLQVMRNQLELFESALAASQSEPE